MKCISDMNLLVTREFLWDHLSTRLKTHSSSFILWGDLSGTPWDLQEYLRNWISKSLGIAKKLNFRNTTVFLVVRPFRSHAGQLFFAGLELKEEQKALCGPLTYLSSRSGGYGKSRGEWDENNTKAIKEYCYSQNQKSHWYIASGLRCVRVSLPRMRSIPCQLLQGGGPGPWILKSSVI